MTRVICADFMLPGTLGHLAAAVDDADSGRPATAARHWQAASAACGLLAGLPGDALKTLLDACRPERTACRADLWRALDATASAVLHVMAGNAEGAARNLVIARALAAMVPGIAESEALAVILDAAGNMAGVTA